MTIAFLPALVCFSHTPPDYRSSTTLCHRHCHLTNLTRLQIGKNRCNERQSSLLYSRNGMRLSVGECRSCSRIPWGRNACPPADWNRDTGNHSPTTLLLLVVSMVPYDLAKVALELNLGRAKVKLMYLG